MKLRREVAAFAQLMEAKLREHDHKGGWKYESTTYLLRRLHNELEELRVAVSSQRKELTRGWPQAEKQAALTVAVGKEAADVANFAMMIADIRGALRPKDIRRQKTPPVLPAKP